MLRFRPRQSDAPSGDVSDLLAVGQVIDDVMRPGHFFVAPELRFEWVAARSETIAWEIFRGRLVDANHTRLQKTFLSWHLIEQNDAHPATEPTISVKFDVRERQVHVTRGLLVYAWEGYDAGGGVIESREVVKWTRELVGTMQLADFADLESVRDELICLIWQAIVGTSRLPLTSVEAPLPAFSFGWLHYLYQSDAKEVPATRFEDLPVGERSSSALETAKLLEVSLRHDNAYDAIRFISALAGSRAHSWGEWRKLWRDLFNNVSLSPQTCLVRNALSLTAIMLPFEKLADFDSERLRQLARHLTAYDLITFHHRGANYPDALLLDDVLKRHVQTAENFPELFTATEGTSRVRRCALRQACLVRRQYQGHLVPDAPTSPGENARVLPAGQVRIPEEQLAQHTRRRRALFSDELIANLLSPKAISTLAQSVADLEHMDERVEMGMGLFIDRPLGYGKQIGESDLTPMLAHEAFSPSIARRRWQELKKLCAELKIAIDASNLDSLFEHGPWPTGLPHTDVADCPRPVAALCDVRKVADDFVILRTKPVGLAQMLGHFGNLQELLRRLGFDSKPPRLCVQTFNQAKQPVLALYDEQLRRRVELQMDASRGYVTRAGVELPRAGLQVTAVYEDDSDGASSS